MKVRGRAGLGTTQLGAGVSVGQVQPGLRQEKGSDFLLEGFWNRVPDHNGVGACCVWSSC